jgi:hypothetical protein
MLSGPALRIKTPSGTGEKLTIPLVAALVKKEEQTVSSGPIQAKNTTYSLRLNNASAIPAEWFQVLTVMDPVKCGAMTNARLIAEVKWRLSSDAAGLWKTGTCKPLKSTEDLAVLQFSMTDGKTVPDQLMIVVTDRLTNVQHKSNSVPVGAYGIKDVLYPLGCFGLLGRPDDFVCKNNTAMLACENLRQQGKPIKCTLAPPKQ